MYEIISNINFAVVLPIITLFVFGISLILSIVMKTSELKHSHFYTFIQIAGPMSVLFISVNMFIDGINIELTRKQQNFEIYQASIEKIYVSIEKEIMDIYTMPMVYGAQGMLIRPEVYASFYSNDSDLYEFTKNLETKPTIESIAGEKYIYNRILQGFEDYLQYQKVWDISDPAWLAVFIRWGQSKYLQENFQNHKSNYDQITIDFAELIFEYSRNIPIPNKDSKAYIEKGKALYKDKRLLKIQGTIKSE